MISIKSVRGLLLTTSAIGLSSLSGGAFAESAAPTNNNALEEVVVTATRQTSTVNKVALSISAVTQKSLDQQGIRSVADLSTQVPGFTFRLSGGDQNPLLTLRGIGGNAIAGTSGAAATTGVYVDDEAFQKRTSNGVVSGSGTPMPLLFDLDRIEVLRGPQGTLYGGSSEGGTLRFITPQPSLTTYTGTARIGMDTVQGGGIGNEEGFAVGGPIVQDKLGFRISAFQQDRAGWVNAYSEYDGHQFGSQINKGNDYNLRASVLWQITPDFKATLSVMNQMNYDANSSTVRTSSPAIKVPLRTFANTGTVNGVKFSFPSTVFGGYTIPAQTWLANNNGVTTGIYLSPTDVQYLPQPRRTLFTAPNLTLDYNWHDKINLKSITGYISDRTSGYTLSGGGSLRSSVIPNSTNQPCPSGQGLVVPILAAANTCQIAPQYLQLNGTTGPANQWGYTLFNNRRGQITEEFRASTIDPSWKLQFVVGAYIEHENNHVNSGSPGNEYLLTQQVRGSLESYWAGPNVPEPIEQIPGATQDDVSGRNIDIVENEQSVFGEANYNLTSKLKITAGVRITNYSQAFSQIYGGILPGSPTYVNSAGVPQPYPGTSDTGAIETNPNSVTPFPNNLGACPTSIAQGVANPGAYVVAGCPYQYTQVTLNEHPIAPKVGISYQLNEHDLLYATYSEGERPGGLNTLVPVVACAADFAALGISQVPLTYQHDTVKSTELGGKFRLFDGRAQINAAAYHIEWDGVQFIINLPTCGFTYIANAATAASDGGEIQATGRLWGFTLNGNLGYDNARYTAAVLGPKPSTGAATVLANKGDNLGVPDWTANLGVQYDWTTFTFPSYARFDYSYTGKYLRTTTAGTSQFQAAVTPNTINGNETHILNARAGIYYKNLEIAGYVKNLGNSSEWINKSQSNGNYYFSGTTVPPRTVGFQVNYRF